MLRTLTLAVSMLIAVSGFAQKDKEATSDLHKSKTYSGLSFRSIGPALTSGRIADMAVHPTKHQEYYLAVASGGVWKTTNSGTTFEPIFDGEGSYSIGCITLAPSNPNIVWVGTGENNNQRSVAYGDGVYKSIDGGSSWKNMGLKNSEHIGMIVVHPKNPNIVYVAAYGPLWNAGGERGIYKTTDGGATWELILEVSENTGFNEIHMDPRNPDVVYATSHQRRRHVWTYIDGGPETAIYKSENGGTNWDKLSNGLPKGDLGRIGMDISPVNPDVVYAIIKATEGGGFFRSMDRGASWTKMSDHQTSGNYYQEIYCDTENIDKVYSMDTWLHHTMDGGKTFVMTGEKDKHVDNHCMWIDPNDNNHWRVGCDGGLYETWNSAEDWKYFSNLPITQFYKVAVDNDLPFYNVYGGTQDNNTQGGPSRTTSSHGILNSDWRITNGGDGFEPQIDPENPDIVYGQAQYGWLVRYDKKSGERVAIQPQPKKGDKAFRWNWDAPLLISPHNNKRLYFAANVLFKSDDRGNSWTKISPDLTQQIDRNELEVMGRVWEPEAVMKNKSTTIYGNIVALDESAVKAGLIYVGTDDGLIQVSENDGGDWSKISSFPGVPANTYVNSIIASQHEEGVVYAAFNNHKQGDFKPYILKSTTKGKTWVSIAANLPERGSVYTIAEDHVNPDLLFVGTEFGVFFTNDGGANWTQLKAGLPTVAVRDIAIQKRENDLVLASFGRSFYVLDDYSSLREMNQEVLDGGGQIFTVKDALLYVESNRYGGKGKSSMGASLFTTPNPDFGAVFTYYVGDTTIVSQKDKRLKKQKADRKSGGTVVYPDIETLRAEDNEKAPFLMFEISDGQGQVVKRMKTKPKTGMQRIAWDLRHTSTSPVKLKQKKPGRYDSPDEGMLALPGVYSVRCLKFQNGEFTPLGDAISFNVKALDNQTLLAADKREVLAFQQQVAELERSLSGTSKLFYENNKKLDFIEAAVIQYPSAPLGLMERVNALNKEQELLKVALYGDRAKTSRDMEALPGLTGRVGYVSYSSWWNTAEPTTTAREQYEIAKNEYEGILVRVQKVTTDISQLEKELVDLKVPYTPGRGADWRQD